MAAILAASRFGETGGGAKVSTLLSMPRAKGLFHRASIQRGAAGRLRTRNGALALTECILRHLGSAGATVAALHEVPVEHLMAAVEPPQAALGTSTWPLFDRYPFGPVVDGDVVPAQPFDPEASPVTAEVPLIIGDLKDRSANFLSAVARTSRVVSSRMVIARRERTIVLMPMQNGMMVYTLRAERDLSSLKQRFDDIPAIKPNSEMEKLATKLIDRQTSKYDLANVETAIWLAAR